MKDSSHRQPPIIRIVPVSPPGGGAQAEALEDLLAVLDRHLSRPEFASCDWHPAFQRMSLAASRSLGRPPLQLLQRLTG